MGGCATKKENKSEYELFNFSKEDFERIKQCYNRLSNFKEKYFVKRTIGKKALQKEFQENPELAVKLYKWLLKDSDNKVITFESFLRSLTKLVHDPTEQDSKESEAHIFDCLETTTLISIEKYPSDREDISRLTLTYSQGLRLLKEITSIFRHSKPAQNNEVAAKVIVNSIFTGSNSKIIDFNNFILYISQQFPLINQFLKLYYSSKFINQDLKGSLKIPYLDSYSILNEELVCLFTLTCNHFQNINELTLLYSKSYFGSSFTNLLLSLKGYEGPTLILLKHVEKESGSKAAPKGGSEYVFGGFSSTPWEEELSYQGNGECFVFSLIPKFKKYYSVLGEGGQNYLYLNGKKMAHSKYKVGLGFGGINYDSFRIWIDENLEKGSYSSPEDHTFEKGALIDSSITELNIEEIEIWGLGGQTALAKQDMYRMHEGIDFRRPIKRDQPTRVRIEESRYDARESFERKRETEKTERDFTTAKLDQQNIGNLPVLGWQGDQYHDINAE